MITQTNETAAPESYLEKLRSTGWTQSVGDLWGAWAVWKRGLDFIVVDGHGRDCAFRATLERAGRSWAWAEADAPTEAVALLVNSEEFEAYDREAR